MKFCHNCGKKVIEGSKFCPECGTSLTSLANKPPTSTFEPFVPKKRAGDEDDDDDEYVDRLSHANVRQSELQVEIVKDRPMGETIGSLVAQAPLGGPPIQDDVRQAPPATQDFLSEFKREAGALRTNEK